MIKLIDLLKEYSVNKPGLKIPAGWEQSKVDPDQDPGDDIEAASYSAPMEGWDEEHHDYVIIYKTPNNEYYIVSSFAFGDYETDKKRFNSLYNAQKRAVEVMEDIMKDWKTDEDDEELNEYEIKKPILFNTDSSKSKLWVDYNPKIRKIDGKELSLLNRVYSALKPVENRLDDSLRLSPSLDRVMMKYGYWEWIEDREILKALKDFNVEIEDDYDDDRGQTTYYMVKDK